MRRRLVVLLAVLSLVAVAAVPAVGKGHATNFRAHLNTAEEVPEPDVDSNPQGQAIFKFAKDGSALSYKLIVANIEDVVAAHIHCAPRGVTGPVGVTLFSGGPTSDSGILAQSEVTAPDPGNSCQWMDLGDVHDAMLSGNAYVNVHTLANLPGEIRGQIH